MAAKATVPVTASVLDWAIREAGLDEEVVAVRADASVDELRRWRRGDAQPRKTQFRKLAKILRRPTAFFFLPEPPIAAGLAAAFRREPRFLHGRQLFPNEASAVRTARRMQRISKWIIDKGVEPVPALPRVDLRTNPHRAADDVRQWLEWNVQEQFEARDAHALANRLRARMQDHGVLTLHFSSQEELACRAFSLSDDVAPLVAVNTQFRYRGAARSFSYLHELGHLTLGDSAMCSISLDQRVERWCEQFAASFLLPSQAVETLLSELGVEYIGTDLSAAQKVASRFKTSLSATAIELIRLGRADDGLYRRVERLAGQRKPPAPGDGPRTPTPQRRLHELGGHYPELLFRAEEENLLRRTDLLDYLSVNDAQLDEVRQLVRR